MTTETTKDLLHRIVEDLGRDEAEELLDYLNLKADPDRLTEAELGRARSIREEMKRGNYVTREEFAEKHGL